MKLKDGWILILAVALCAVALALPWPKLPQARAATAEPAGDHYKDLRAGIKALGDTAFDSMKETAEAAIKIADYLNSEVTAQAQKRAALEAAVERLGYQPSYSSSNGAVRCELTAIIQPYDPRFDVNMTTNRINWGAPVIITNTARFDGRAESSALTLTNAVFVDLSDTNRTVDMFMQGKQIAVLRGVTDVIPHHDTNEPLCTLVRYWDGSKEREFHAWMAEVRDAATGKVLAAGPTPKQWAEMEKLATEAVEQKEVK